MGWEEVWPLQGMLGKVVTTRDAGKMVSTRDGRKCGLCKGCWERRSLPGMLGNVVSTGHGQKCILCKASGKCSVWRELGKLASDVGCHTERRKEGRMLVDTESLSALRYLIPLMFHMFYSSLNLFGIEVLLTRQGRQHGV